MTEFLPANNNNVIRVFCFDFHKKAILLKVSFWNIKIGFLQSFTCNLLLIYYILRIYIKSQNKETKMMSKWKCDCVLKWHLTTIYFSDYTLIQSHQSHHQWFWTKDFRAVRTRFPTTFPSLVCCSYSSFSVQFHPQIQFFDVYWGNILKMEKKIFSMFISPLMMELT